MSTAPSPPSLRFRDNLKEARELLKIHVKLTGTGPGARRGVEVLNKSAILFTCAAFEAFIEDLATDAFQHLVADAADHTNLPKVLKKAIAEALKADKNELKVWELAGSGWKTVAEQYKLDILRTYAGTFNTPKPHNIESLVRQLTGFQDIHKHWTWHGMSASRASTKLRTFVELRGALAHGERPPPKVTKVDVIDYIDFLAPLSVRCSNEVRAHCQTITGRYPWAEVHFNKVR